VDGSVTSVSRSIVNKKAKAEKNGATSPTTIEASIDMMISEVTSSLKKEVKTWMRRTMQGGRHC
jgi:hypothetical protein